MANRRAARLSSSLVERCTSQAVAAGASVDVEYPASPRELGEALMRACRGYDFLVVAGGDGTVGLVANMLGCDLPIAIIPAGRGNTFYKSIFGDAEPCGILGRALANPRILRVDLGYIVEESRLFVLGSTLGFIPEVIESARKYAALGGRLSYALAALERVLRGAGGSECRVEAGGSRVFEGELSMVSLGLTKYRAGRFKLFPEAEPDDGLLDYLVVPRLSRLGSLRLLVKSLRGEHIGPSILYGKASRITVTCRGSLPLEADGDVLGSRSSLTFEVRPSRLSLLTPS